MPNAPDEKKDSPQAAAAEPIPAPVEVDDAQLGVVVGGVLRRGGDDDLDDLEVER